MTGTGYTVNEPVPHRPPTVRTNDASRRFMTKTSGAQQEEQVIFVGDDWAEDHHDVAVMDGGARCWPAGACLRGWPGWRSAMS